MLRQASMVKPPDFKYPKEEEKEKNEKASFGMVVHNSAHFTLDNDHTLYINKTLVFVYKTCLYDIK